MVYLWLWQWFAIETDGANLFWGRRLDDEPAAILQVEGNLPENRP